MAKYGSPAPSQVATSSQRPFWFGAQSEFLQSSERMPTLRA